MEVGTISIRVEEWSSLISEGLIELQLMHEERQQQLRKLKMGCPTWQNKMEKFVLKDELEILQVAIRSSQKIIEEKSF